MYSKGITWIDDCRIPFENDGDNNTTRGQYENKVQVGIMAERPNIKFVGSFDDSAKQGRFPANILVSDDMLNDGVINGGGSYSGIKTRERIKFFNERGVMNSTAQSPDNYGDKGSNSRYYNIDKWFENLIK